MPTQYINKVIYGGNTLIDLTEDTVVANKLLSGYTAHDKSGAPITGSCNFNVNASDANASASEILANKTAYVGSSKVTGTMVNNGSVTGTITTKAQQYTIPVGYHDGSGKVSISSTEQAKIIATNIRQGVTILGVEGSMTGTEDVTAETVTVTPATTAQTVTPSTGYNYISQVTVNAIPYSETANPAGGLTATIA